MIGLRHSAGGSPRAITSPVVGASQAAEDAQQRRLAAARGADHGQHPALIDREAQVVEHGEAAVVVAEAARFDLHRRRLAGRGTAPSSAPSTTIGPARSRACGAKKSSTSTDRSTMPVALEPGDLLAHVRDLEPAVTIDHRRAGEDLLDRRRDETAELLGESARGFVGGGTWAWQPARTGRSTSS